MISLAFGQWRSSMFGVLGLYDHRPPTTAMMHHPETVETKRCRKDFSPKLQRQKRPGPQMAQTPFGQKPGSKLSNPLCSLHTWLMLWGPLSGRTLDVPTPLPFLPSYIPHGIPARQSKTSTYVQGSGAQKSSCPTPMVFIVLSEGKKSSMVGCVMYIFGLWL